MLEGRNMLEGRSRRHRFYRLFQWILSLVVASSAVLMSSSGYAAERLDDEAIAQRITTLPGWEIEDNALVCTYQFENFVESVDFVNQLVEPAESVGHHPDVVIVYNQVTVFLTTHDADGLTDLDFELAETITTLADPEGDRPCE